MPKPLQSGHERITEKNLDRFTIYNDEELYWDNKPIVVKTKLSWKSRIWIGLVALPGIFVALVGVLNNIDNINKDLCVVHIGIACTASTTNAGPPASAPITTKSPLAAGSPAPPAVPPLGSMH